MKLTIIIERAINPCLLFFLTSKSQLTNIQNNAHQTPLTKETISIYQNSPQLLNIIGAVLGLIGVVLLYQKWKNDDAGCGKFTAVLTAGCIVLAILATVLKLFF